MSSANATADAGALDVAPIDGCVSLDSIAGSTTLARVRTADISSIAGGLTIGLAPVAGEGIRISSIVGPVNLNLERGVDADLRVDSVMGSVRSLAPGADFVERHGTYHARFGAGGGRVSLSSVVGPVRVRRP
jgi:hypothetical protein